MLPLILLFEFTILSSLLSLLLLLSSIQFRRFRRLRASCRNLFSLSFFDSMRPAPGNTAALALWNEQHGPNHTP